MTADPATHIRDASRLPIATTRFYQLAIWIPILLPMLVWIFGDAIPRGPVRELVAWVLPSLVFGGIPYSLFAVAVSRWIRGKPPRRTRLLSMAIPPIFLLFYWVFGLGMALISGRHMDAAMLTMLLVFGAFVVAYGYGYVLFVELLRWTGSQLRLVERLPPTGPTRPAR